MILGDWGTTRLRLYKSAEPGAEKLVGPGIGQLEAPAREVLAQMLARWPSAAKAAGVLLSGMAGSRDGVVEVPYVETPAGFDDWARCVALVDGFECPVRVATGLRTRNFAGLPDVLRGEEAQVFGAIVREPPLGEGEHLVILPGTHSKLVTLTAGSIGRFHTFATGELFALLRDHSTLVGKDAEGPGSDGGFVTGLEQSARGPLGGIFTARAARLIDGRSPSWSLGYLSGLLIGAELAEALALVNPGTWHVHLIGEASLTALYRRAAARLGFRATVHDGDACVIAGLERLAQVCEGAAC